MLNTERLILRPFKEDDLDDMLQLWNDAPVQRGLTNAGVVPRPPKYKDKLQGFVDSALFYVVITLKETGEFMGTCNIWLAGGNPKNRDGMLGISIVRTYWNQGYGSEALIAVVGHAFQWLGLHRVSLGVFESNMGAIAAYEKLGFVVEGRKRKANWADGKWEDILDMAVLDDEWAAFHSKQIL